MPKPQTPAEQTPPAHANSKACGSRQRPVVVDLGGKIFDPDGGTTFSNQTQLIPPQRDLPLSQRTTLSYYRAVLNYINGKGAQSDKSDGSDLGSVF